MKLRDYLLEERGRQACLADAIGAHAPDISRWAEGTRQVPIPYCSDIEKATNGAVTRKDLRPNDWRRIWPELAEKPAKTSKNKH